jgi:tellurite methyltransferase
MIDLADQLGGIDIYLLDQILRGRIHAGQRILDVGCGNGRNLTWLLRQGFDVSAVDTDVDCVAHVRSLVAELAPHLDGERVHVAGVKEMPFADDAFDVVVANAVLHFARDPDHFEEMLGEVFRVLAPGGILFTRLASSIGFEEALQPLGNGRYHMPDDTDRYTVDLETLLGWTERVGGALLDPIKTTNVQGLRCITTWVLRTGS